MSIDGNGVAGLLAEVFGADMTTVRRRCADCREEHEIGAHRAYRGAAVVLRCPGCGAVAARLSADDDRRLVELRGTWELAAAPA